MAMSSAGRAENTNGCVTRPKGREIGLKGFAAQIQLCSPTGSYVMATAEHREPYESRGSRTVLGARGGEIPPRDSTTSVLRRYPRDVRLTPASGPLRSVRLKSANSRPHALQQATRLYRRRASHPQLDVLVQAEEVGRIILVLQGDQLRILRRTIGGLHPLCSLVRLLPQIVDVHPIGRERLHRLPELARPPDARRGLRRIRARPGADKVIANVAVVKRGLFLTHAAHRAPQFVNRDVAPRRRPGRPVGDHGVDGVIAEILEEIGFPIDLGLSWIRGIERALECGIGYGIDVDCEGAAVGSEGVQDSFPRLDGPVVTDGDDRDRIPCRRARQERIAGEFVGGCPGVLAVELKHRFSLLDGVDYYPCQHRADGMEL